MGKHPDEDFHVRGDSGEYSHVRGDSDEYSHVRGDFDLDPDGGGP